MLTVHYNKGDPKLSMLYLFNDLLLISERSMTSALVYC